MSRSFGGSTARDDLERRVSELESGGSGGGGGGGTTLVGSSLKSTNAGASGLGVIALGRDVQATGSNAVAVGADARANAQNAVALGLHSGKGHGPEFSGETNHAGVNSISIGYESVGMGTNSIALGTDSEATHISSICINATGAHMDTHNANSLVIAPVRPVPRALGVGVMHYDSGTGEVTYSSDAASGGTSVSFAVNYTDTPHVFATGANTDTIVPFNNVLHDSSTAFNTSTYSYVVPVAGVFRFYFRGTFNLQNGGQYANVYIEKQGVDIAESIRMSNHDNKGDASYDVTTTVECAQGDIIRCKFQASYQTNYLIGNNATLPNGTSAYHTSNGWRASLHEFSGHKV